MDRVYYLICLITQKDGVHRAITIMQVHAEGLVFTATKLLFISPSDLSFPY